MYHVYHDILTRKRTRMHSVIGKKQKLVLVSTIAVQSLQLKHTHTQTYFALTIKFLNMQQVLHEVEKRSH